MSPLSKFISLLAKDIDCAAEYKEDQNERKVLTRSSVKIYVVFLTTENYNNVI